MTLPWAGVGSRLVEEAGGGGENGVESWTEPEEGLTTDPNGSESSSRPEPKSEAASCTVLILSYPRRFPMDAAGPRSETKWKFWKNAELWECVEENIGLLSSHRARDRKLWTESSGGKDVMRAMSV